MNIYNLRSKVMGAKIIGGLIIAFGIVDFVSYNIFEVDLTGVLWSPVAAGIIGGVIWSLGDKGKKEQS